MTRKKVVEKNIPLEPCPDTLSHVDRMLVTAIKSVTRDIGLLIHGLSPECEQEVHRVLDNPTKFEAAQLECWRRCGRRDMQRTPKVCLRGESKRTVTPFGIACLWAYGAAWVDEAETRLAALQKAGLRRP